MFSKKFKSKYLNEVSGLINNKDVKNNSESVSDSMGSFESKNDQGDSDSKSEISSENRYKKIKKKNCDSKSRKMLDVNYDHSHVDQDCVVSNSETLVEKVPRKNKKKRRKSLDNDDGEDDIDEKLHREIKKAKQDACERKKEVSKDGDDIDDHHTNQNHSVSNSEILVEKIPRKIKKKKKRKCLDNDDKKEDGDDINGHCTDQNNLVSYSEIQVEKLSSKFKKKKRRKNLDNDDSDEKLHQEIKEPKQDLHNRKGEVSNNYDDIEDHRTDQDHSKFEVQIKEKKKKKKKKNRRKDLNDADENSADSLPIEHEKDSISKPNIDVLRELKIALIHEVPKQHFLEKNAGSHAPNPDTMRRFEKYTLLKKGTYTKQEDGIIIENWHKFCDVHNWNREEYQPFLNWKQEKVYLLKHLEERRKFVQFLANGLPNRTLYSVYHRFKNLYGTCNRTRYSVDEDLRILDYIENNSDRDNMHVFSDLAKKLNRTRASVWRRYQLLKKKKKLNK